MDKWRGRGTMMGSFVGFSASLAIVGDGTEGSGFDDDSATSLPFSGFA